MKAKVTLEIDLLDMGATEKQVKDYIEYILSYTYHLSRDNPYFEDYVEVHKITDIEIELS